MKKKSSWSSTSPFIFAVMFLWSLILIICTLRWQTNQGILPTLVSLHAYNSKTVKTVELLFRPVVPPSDFLGPFWLMQICKLWHEQWGVGKLQLFSLPISHMSVAYSRWPIIWFLFWYERSRTAPSHCVQTSMLNPFRTLKLNQSFSFIITKINQNEISL